MSQGENRHEAQRWLDTTQEDLEAADVLFESQNVRSGMFPRPAKW
jgi:hypothetical protein